MFLFVWLLSAASKRTSKDPHLWLSMPLSNPVPFGVSWTSGLLLIELAEIMEYHF